jgi:DNA-binding response OmpR family regulator
MKKHLESAGAGRERQRRTEHRRELRLKGVLVNILLVEDEERVASFVSKGLAAEGHHVELASTAADGASMALTYDFDLVLLDLMLPDAHGRDALARIRQVKADVPVIVVSALGQIEDKVELLDLGANDFLVKPFAFAELAARVRAAGRQGQATGRLITAGDLTLDTRTRIAKRGEDVHADLPSREYALLEYLMRHAGQVLSRQQILDAVWGIDFDTDSNVVDVYVSYIRRKLDRPSEPSVIETVRGAGYRVRS